MANRREFLQLGASALGLASVPGMAFTGTLPNNSRMPFDLVVYDERIPDCEIFADQLRRLGADTHAIKGDVSELWYGRLRAQLSEIPGVIVGLTTESSAFLLQVLGHDVFHHQVFRGDHIFKDDKAIGHRFTSPEYLLKKMTDIDHDNQQWSTDMAGLLAQYDASNTGAAKATIGMPVRPDEPTHNLVSWIIEPIYKNDVRRL